MYSLAQVMVPRREGGGCKLRTSEANSPGEGTWEPFKWTQLVSNTKYENIEIQQEQTNTYPPERGRVGNLKGLRVCEHKCARLQHGAWERVSSV